MCVVFLCGSFLYCCVSVMLLVLELDLVLGRWFFGVVTPYDSIFLLGWVVEGVWDDSVCESGFPVCDIFQFVGVLWIVTSV